MFINRRSAPAFAALLASLTIAGVAKADATATLSGAAGPVTTNVAASAGAPVQAQVSASSQGTSVQAAGVTASAGSQGVQAQAGYVSASTSSQGMQAKVGSLEVSTSSSGSIDPAVTIKGGSIELAPKATVKVRAKHTVRSAHRGTKRIVRHTMSSVRSLLDIHVSGTVNAQAGGTNALVSIH
jgi:hypothetical protein